MGQSRVDARPLNTNKLQQHLNYLFWQAGRGDEALPPDAGPNKSSSTASSRFHVPWAQEPESQHSIERFRLSSCYVRCKAPEEIQQRSFKVIRAPQFDI